MFLVKNKFIVDTAGNVISAQLQKMYIDRSNYMGIYREKKPVLMGKLTVKILSNSIYFSK